MFFPPQKNYHLFHNFIILFSNNTHVFINNVQKFKYQPSQDQSIILSLMTGESSHLRHTILILCTISILPYLETLLAKNIFSITITVCSVFSIYWQHDAVFTTNPSVEYYCHIILPGTCRKGCAARWTIVMKNSLYNLKFPSVNVSQFERILDILLWAKIKKFIMANPNVTVLTFNFDTVLFSILKAANFCIAADKPLYQIVDKENYSHCQHSLKLKLPSLHTKYVYCSCHCSTTATQRIAERDILVTKLLCACTTLFYCPKRKTHGTYSSLLNSSE